MGNERMQRLKRLLHRGGGVEAVNLVQIDVIELQPPEAGLARVDQVIARRAASIGTGMHFPVSLGRDDNLLPVDAEVSQRCADDFLRRAA